MRTAFWFAAAAWLLTAVTVQAQEAHGEDAKRYDPTVTAWSAEKIDCPPARELKFERLEEPALLRLYRPDPKLIGEKYVATLRIALRNERSETRSLVDASLRLFGPSEILDPQSAVRAESLEASMQRIVEATPEDRRPPAEVLAFFTSEEVDQGHVLMSAHRGGAETYRELRVLAPSAETAEARSSGLLSLLDQGYTRPIQGQLWSKRSEMLADWLDRRKAIEDADEKIAALNNNISSLDNYEPEMLADLRLLRLQLEVDRAGAEARIAAADKRLQGAPAESHQAIHDLKTAAQIEIAGYEARMAKADEFIADVVAKRGLVSELQTATATRTRQSQISENRARLLQGIEAALDRHRPLTVVNDKVVIQPIEWTR